MCGFFKKTPRGSCAYLFLLKFWIVNLRSYHGRLAQSAWIVKSGGRILDLCLMGNLSHYFFTDGGHDVVHDQVAETGITDGDLSLRIGGEADNDIDNLLGFVYWWHGHDFVPAIVG